VISQFLQIKAQVNKITVSINDLLCITILHEQC